MTPIISVVIPAHNEEKYISQTLNSLKEQTMQDFETIVVANGCTDNTEKIVDEFVKKGSLEMKKYSIGNANVSRARNHGAAKAQGEILFFLDADTKLHTTVLEKVKNEFTQDKAMAVPKVRANSDLVKHKIMMVGKNLWNWSGIYKSSMGTGTFICHKKHFDKINGYDADIVVKEHRHLARKLLKLGKYVRLNAEVTTSMRRYQQWGLIKATGFWIKKYFEEKSGKLKDATYEKIR